VPRIDIDGLGIAYERAGEGPPIVLLHGGVSDGREWRRQIEALASEYTLVAWDAPGNGRSDDPPESFRMPDVERDLAQSPQTLARSFLATLLTDSAPAELADELLAILVDLHPAGALAQAHAMAEADLRDVLPDIAVPTLLLYGEQDVRSPRAVAGELAAQIPDAELVLIPGAGHMLNMEAADRVNAELLRFLGAI
jgi:pimeloyl-ACP methyl ester carboxylesterase